MANFDESSILALGTEPIPGAVPTGIDAADDENYILVLAELSKLGRIEEGEPDWYSMESAATVFLQAKSKDVEIAAALGHSLFKQKGYWGLAAALKLLVNLIVTYWDGLFPERPRRRKARIESLMDVFTDGGWFRDNQPKSDDFDAIDLCVERIQELNNAILERMPDDKPEFDKFIRGIKELAAKRPKAAEPAPAPAPAGGAAPAGGGGSVGSAAFASAEVGDVNSAENAIDKAAAFILKADITSPMPYAVSRLLKWSMIRLPESDDAKYQIPNPEASVLDAIQHQAANSLWEHLLTSSEGAFRTEDPLWLDLQKHTCAAMTGMGPRFDNARHVIMAMTAGLVKRLGSGLFELRFRNGTPLCSGDTKMWIESELIGGSGGGGGGSGGGANGKLTEASENARKLAGGGKLKEAVAALQEGLAGCSQRRDRFLWRLQIAQLCFDAQRIQLALPLLEECFEDVKRFHIEDWEPAIAVEAAQTLYRCRKAQAILLKEPAPELEPGVRESFAWLCQLDPSAALAVEPSGK